jgi:hypothetical protein
MHYDPARRRELNRLNLYSVEVGTGRSRLVEPAAVSTPNRFYRVEFGLARFRLGFPEKIPDSAQ